MPMFLEEGWWDKLMGRVSDVVADPPEQEVATANKDKKKQKPKRVSKRPKSVQSDRVLQVSTKAMLKGLVLQAATSLEWSGYGALTRDGDNFILHDFYYLSDQDTNGSTNLSPEDVYKAWKLIEADGYDTKDMFLAWVHCHPFGMGGQYEMFESNGTRWWSVGGAWWSMTDEDTIDDGVGWTGEQVSILFSGNQVIARRDTVGLAEEMLVQIDWGEFNDDLVRAKGALKRRPQFKGTTKKAKTEDKTTDNGDTALVVLTDNMALKCSSCGASAIISFKCDYCEKYFCVTCMSTLTAGVALCFACDKKLAEMCERCVFGDRECLICANSLCEEHAQECALCGATICEEHAKEAYDTIVCSACYKELFQNGDN